MVAERLERYEGSDEWDIEALELLMVDYVQLRERIPVADEHPPTFHIRRHIGPYMTTEEARLALGPTAARKLPVQWSWSCVAANRKQTAWSGETYVDHSHAVKMCREFARAYPGARIIDHDGNEL